MVGTWIDGSTLYEKTIDFGALPSSAGTYDVSLGISGYDKICTFEIIVSDGSTFINLPFFSANSQYNITGYLTTINNVLYVEGAVGMDRSSFNNNKVIVRYTKAAS